MIITSDYLTSLGDLAEALHEALGRGIRGARPREVVVDVLRDGDPRAAEERAENCSRVQDIARCKRAFHAITRGLRYVSGLVDTSDAHETKRFPKIGGTKTVCSFVLEI